MLIVLFGVVHQMAVAEFEVKGTGKWQAMVQEEKLVVAVELGGKDNYKPEKTFTLSVGGCPVKVVAGAVGDMITFSLGGGLAVNNPKSFTVKGTSLTFEPPTPNPIPCSSISFAKLDDGNLTIDIGLSDDVPSGLVLKPQAEEYKGQEKKAGADADKAAPVGTIIGVIVGVLLFIGLAAGVGAAVWWFWWRKKKGARAADAKGKGTLGGEKGKQLEGGKSGEDFDEADEKKKKKKTGKSDDVFAGNDPPA